MARINKDGLLEVMSLHTVFADTTKKDTKEFLEDFLSTIVNAVADGDEVTIAGFGKFEPFTLANGTVVPKFRAFKEFKDAVAQ